MAGGKGHDRLPGKEPFQWHDNTIYGIMTLN